MKEPEHGAIILAKKNAKLKQLIEAQQETIQRLEAKIKSLEVAAAVAAAQGHRGLPWR